ncbi:MAG: hypothetical protein ACHRXM_10245 [Isosphaerales bacterium]
MRTTPAATPPAPPVSSPSGPAAPAVRSLDDLYHLTAQNERAVFRGVDWAYYERLLSMEVTQMSPHASEDS